MVNKTKIKEFAKDYLDMQIMNAGARPESVYELIDALQKVPGLPSVRLRKCRRLGRLEKWANSHFSEKSANIELISSYDARQYDSYSIVEHIRKESGLDFVGIKTFGKEFGCLLTYEVPFDSYVSLSLMPFEVGWAKDTPE